MEPFEALFRKSKGQPVEYNGRTIQLVDRIPIKSPSSIRLIFESVNADWRQGVLLRTDRYIEVNDQQLKKLVVLWQDTAPKEVVMLVTSKKGELQVKNVWDTGDGTMDSGHNGAAMIVEGSGTTRRYLCNDGRPDDDFDDLVFRLVVE